jgi:hypothetical protein
LNRNTVLVTVAIGYVGGRLAQALGRGCGVFLALVREPG